MATVINSHQQAALTTPINNTSPIDANQVTGNDNAVATTYNAHDADPGIHIQSSLLASRPAAGTAGRIWFTSDGLQFYYDNGSSWLNPTVGTVSAANVTHGTFGSATSDGNSYTFTGLLVLSRGLQVTAGTISNACIANDSTYGLAIEGANNLGTYDFSIMKAAGGLTPVLAVPAGTSNIAIPNGTLTVSGGVIIGTNPASIGPVRLANNTWVTFRNAANNADIQAFGVNSSDQIFIGVGSNLVTTNGALTVSASPITLNAANPTIQAIASLANNTAKMYVTDGTIAASLAVSGGVGYVQTETSHALHIRTNNTDAITISTAQAATFAGLIIASAGITINGGSFATGKIYKDAGNGLTAIGITGSNYDFALYDPAGNLSGGIINVPTGTGNVAIPNGKLKVGTATPLSPVPTVVIGGSNSQLQLDAAAATNAEIYFSVTGTSQFRIGLTGAANNFRIRDDSATTDRYTISSAGVHAFTGTATISGALTLSAASNTVAIPAGGTGWIFNASTGTANTGIGLQWQRGGVTKWQVGSAFNFGSDAWEIYDQAGGVSAFRLDSNSGNAHMGATLTVASNIVLGTNNTALQGTTSGSATVNLIRLTNDANNITRFHAGVDNGGFQWTNQAASTQWMGLSASQLTLNGQVTSYNNISTAGIGLHATYAQARKTAQTAASGTVATYTTPASDGSYLVCANVLVTAAVTCSFTVTCTYTDEGNTSRTLTLSFSQVSGTILSTITNVTGTGAYEGIPLYIRAKASTAITIQSAAGGTYTSVTYNIEGAITQVA